MRPIRKTGFIEFGAVSDEDLYAMCRAGDELAWQYVFNYVLYVVDEMSFKRSWRLRDDAEEMAQEVTVHIIEKAMRQLKEKDKFRAFIRRVTVNKVLDSFKRPAHEPLERTVKDRKGEEYTEETPDPRPGHDRRIMNLQILRVVDAAIGKLSAECQRVVRAYLDYKVGRYDDYQELSGVLNMPVPTISSRVTRCLRRLFCLDEMKALADASGRP